MLLRRSLSKDNRRYFVYDFINPKYTDWIIKMIKSIFRMLRYNDIAQIHITYFDGVDTEFEYSGFYAINV